MHSLKETVRRGQALPYKETESEAGASDLLFKLTFFANKETRVADAPWQGYTHL